MNHKERQLQILNLLNEEKEVSVEDLAEKFNVSASTIRRELNSMNKLGLIIRTHGGALVQVNKNDEILDHTKRKFHNYHEKMEIAKKAASYIKDNEFVFLHSSSITDLMPPFLTAKNITVATNSLNIAKSLTEADDCQLLLIGGLYYKYAEAIEGTMTVEQIHSMHFQKAFLGANGVDLEMGFSTITEFELGSKIATVNASDETFFLCEHQKFGRKSAFQIVGLEAVNHIITDSKLPDETCKKYSAACHIILSGSKKQKKTPC